MGTKEGDSWAIVYLSLFSSVKFAIITANLATTPYMVHKIAQASSLCKYRDIQGDESV